MQSLRLNFVHILALIIIFSIYRKLEKSSKAIDSLIEQSKKIDNFNFKKNKELELVNFF